MRKDFLEEVNEFNNLYNNLLPNAIKKVKENIIQMHSVREENIYEKNVLGHIEMKTKTFKQIVEGINVKTFIEMKTNCDFIKNKVTIEDCNYRLMITVITDKTFISDGKVSYLIWESLKNDIDLKNFPHFEPPIFNKDKKQLQ